MRRTLILLLIFSLATAHFAYFFDTPSAHAAVRVNRLGISEKTYFASTVNPPNLQNGLVGYWTFNGKDMKPNVRDRSGQGNHGTLTGYTSTTTVPGKVGQAISCNGSSQYVNLMSGQLVSSSSPVTIAFWLKGLSSSWSSQFQNPIYGEVVDTTQNYIVVDGSQAITGTAGKVYFDQFGPNGITINSTTVLAVNRWYHIAVTRNGSAQAMYINGALEASNNSAEVYTGNTPTLTAVCGWPAANRYTNMAVDDLRVYNRALSASEIAQIYNLGTGSHQSVTTSPGGLQSGLVGHWTFDGKDMTSTNALDRSGQRNNGGLAGGLSKIPGRLGQALQFNGSDTYISVSASTSLSNWSAQSTAFWFKTSGTGMSQYSRLIEKGANNEWTVYWDSAIVVPTLGAASPPIVSSPLGLGDNKWHHAAVTISSDATASVKLYIDGVLSDSDTSAQPAGKTNGIIIGRYSTGGYNFNGSMDDVRVYNRELSAAEILQLYNLGR